MSTTAANGSYNFGAGTTALGNADRAPGFLASGTATQSGNLYARLANNTGSALTGLLISYDVEKYRNGSNPAGFRYQLFYSTNGTEWTSAGPDFLTSFVPDADNSGFATAPGASVPVSNKTLNVAIPNGSELFLSWNYSVNTGVITTNAPALAIDNVSILGVGAPVSTNPSGVGAANPNSVLPGAATVLTVTGTPGTNPASTGLAVTADLTAIGGAVNQQFFDDGINGGDTTAGDNIFTYTATVSLVTTPGAKSLPFTISDAQARSGNGSINLTVQTPPPPAVDHLVISQLYGGGGNSGATLTHDYVEIYNPSSISFNLAGWSLQYASVAGTSWTNKQPLGGTIAPGEYFLVQLASGGANGAPLAVLPNITGDINMSATAGKIALVSNSVSLSGSCPNGIDPDIVDFVGYGPSASCFEGAARASTPSNTNALFRKLERRAGHEPERRRFSDRRTRIHDVPRRSSSSVRGSPVPNRLPMASTFRTTPRSRSISVKRLTSPDRGSTSTAPVLARITVRPWLRTTSRRATTSRRTSASSLASSAPSRSCTRTFTIRISTTARQTPTRCLPITRGRSRSSGAGAPAPHPPSVHLAFGNPSNAVADLLQPNNYLMEKPSFTLSYNRDKGTPNWVSWHLETDWTGSLPRTDTFRADPAVSPDWYRVQSTDYFASGFDRGHMTPNADRDNPAAIPLNQETFLMSNMVPQAPNNNQGPWADLENFLRTLLTTNEVYVVAGPAGVGGSGDNGPANTIANGNVTVPAFTWKVALVLPAGDDDVSRVSASTRAIAVIMPNDNSINSDWHTYLTTVDAVEALTGYDFFANVPDAIENAIEAGIDGNNPPGTENQSPRRMKTSPRKSR